jgi:glycosyltransferase involved in cell wall biosynthesis
MSSWGNRPIPKRIQPSYNPQSYNQPSIIPQPSIKPINIKPHLYTPDISFNDSYELTLSRISSFNEHNTDALITFIIPTINRNSLLKALQSLINQSITNWKAIVVFDGCEPIDNELLKILLNDRFLYISINKQGIFKDKTHGAAGFVRNIAMSIVNTPWTGFLDDDDHILPNYTQSLLEEIKINPSAELISFRMIDKTQILPPDYMTTIEFGYIGISFCYKTQLFQDGFKFIQSGQEDFDFINNIKDAKKKIILSPFITYIVRDSSIINAPPKRRFQIN